MCHIRIAGGYGFYNEPQIHYIRIPKHNKVYLHNSVSSLVTTCDKPLTRLWSIYVAMFLHTCIQ